MGLKSHFDAILEGYLEAKTSPLASSHPMARALCVDLVDEIRSTRPIAGGSTLSVKGSVGVGNWAQVPWIVVLDSRETANPQDGVYCVYLFRADMQGVYLTLNQGVTKPKQSLGARAAREFMVSRKNAIRLRQERALAARGFDLSDSIELGDGNLAREYEASTIAHKFYRAGSVPDDAQLIDDLDAVVASYNEYLRDKPPEAVPSARSEVATDRAWIFQASPEFFDIRAALKELPEIGWRIKQHAASIAKGHRVYVWESGKNAGVVAVGALVEDPIESEEYDGNKRFLRDEEKLSGKMLRARVSIERVLESPISKKLLVEHEILRNLSILNQAIGSNFPMTEEQRAALDALIEGMPSAEQPAELVELPAITAAFSAALKEAMLSFGPDHDVLTKTFLASLATKPFVILSGL